MNVFTLNDEYEFECIDEALSKEPDNYKQYFSPSGRIGKFWEISDFSKDGMTRYHLGFFMVRGFEYPIPRFGVYIFKKYSHMGLGRLAICYAESWCRLHEHKKLELTVHPKNKVAIRLYKKEGYKTTGKKSDKGHVIYQKSL